MFEPPPGYRVILESRHRRACLEARLVLSSARIDSEALHYRRLWYLVVLDDDFDAAEQELKTYAEENKTVSRKKKPIRLFEDGFPGVLGYSAIVILFFLLNARSFAGLQWNAVGQSQSDAVIQGEWWRCFTALTLHADIGHICGNLVFGGLFGYFAGRNWGVGVAWLTIALAGALGNLVNAFIRPAEHFSIGASTAVFAALGMLVSDTLQQQWSDRRAGVEDRPGVLKRWSPLIAGLVLFGFTGIGGERTDVGAHAAGMFAGMLLGWACNWIPRHLLFKRGVQAATAIVAVAIIAVSWYLAIANRVTIVSP